jgi:hypothetical protein
LQSPSSSFVLAIERIRCIALLAAFKLVCAHGMALFPDVGCAIRIDYATCDCGAVALGKLVSVRNATQRH